jgi:ABC-2 type transport system permease protein
VHWDVAHVGIGMLAIICGAVIFAALFLLAGALQFWLIDGAEFTNSFTYSSHYVSQFAIALMTRPVRAFFTFVIPAAFVGYIPTLALLGLTGPFGLGAHTLWALPVAAVTITVMALAVWWTGIHHYTGAGG